MSQRKIYILTLDRAEFGVKKELVVLAFDSRKKAQEEMESQFERKHRFLVSRRFGDYITVKVRNSVEIFEFGNRQGEHYIWEIRDRKIH